MDGGSAPGWRAFRGLARGRRPGPGDGGFLGAACRGMGGPAAARRSRPHPVQRAGTEPPSGYPLRAALLTAGAVLLILFARRPESFLHPQFYAEDGAVFYVGAHRDPWGSILTPYAGYLHLASRLVEVARV